MEQYLASVNAGSFYAIVAGVLAFITLMCVVFLVKSYRAGIRIGMDKKVLRKAITASATFTLLPSISILLGVIALSGTLGVPFSWLRLSVIGIGSPGVIRIVVHLHRTEFEHSKRLAHLSDALLPE